MLVLGGGIVFVHKPAPRLAELPSLPRDKSADRVTCYVPKSGGQMRPSV